MYKINKTIYGDSRISKGCLNCVFKNEPFNYGKCENCNRNMELPEEMREIDNWIDIAYESLYYEKW